MAIRTGKLLINTLFPAWLIVSIIIFAFVNRVSFIHAFSFPSGQFFLQQISRISPAPYLIDLLKSLAGISFFTITCTGLGLIALKRLRTPSVSGLAFGITAFITGEILFSLFFLAVISQTSLSPVVTSTTLIFCFIAGIPALWKFRQSLSFQKNTSGLGSRQRMILWWVIGILALSLTLSTARLGYDAVSDYFSQAKLMAVSQKASSFFPGNYMIVSSLHPDILFTALIQMFGDQAARMLSLVNGLAILLMGYVLAEEAGLSPCAREYYLILLLTSTAFTDLLGDGKVELISTAPIIGAIYWMSLSIKSPAKENFLLIGFLTGFAIISRLYNIFLVSLFTALFFVFWLIRETSKEWSIDPSKGIKALVKFTQPLLWMLPTLVLMGGFHLWQNWVWLGSPLAPLQFAPKLESSNWEWQFDPGVLNLLRFLYPLTVTFFNTPQSLGDISPLFVGFLPFLLVKNIRTKIRFVTNYLLGTGILTLILWLAFFYTVVEIRYVFFIWILLFLPAAQLIEHSMEFVPKAISTLMQLMLILVLSFTSFRVAAISITTYSPIDAAGNAHCSDIGFCTFFNLVNKIASPNDRVFALQAFRYYLRMDLLACSSRADEYPLLQALAQQNSPDFWSEAYRQGFRFITYEENFAVNHSRFGTIPDPKIAPLWLKISVVSPVNDKNNVAYRIDAIDPPFQPEILCRYDDHQNKWSLIRSR